MDVYDQMKVVVSLMCSGFVFGFAIIDVKHREIPEALFCEGVCESVAPSSRGAPLAVAKTQVTGSLNVPKVSPTAVGMRASFSQPAQPTACPSKLA